MVVRQTPKDSGRNGSDKPQSLIELWSTEKYLDADSVTEPDIGFKVTETF